MNVEEIKELSKELNQVSRNLELQKGYFSLLRTLLSKEKSVQEKAMVFYLALENDGVLSVIQNDLEDMVIITNKADDFIFKVAEELEDKTMIRASRGTKDEK
ncbi:hypothetical protein DOK76_03800 [Vagococcus sp. DIV0080]|uniref:Uncharacterized protein n=1 Tax=Candidatus Vagococcus giribetii TaxID=2230876 RepID=A0ABS3HR35_9ENTE|nr:hypothetical protein [Vagococcus sp. DIV0080]MBO0476179.1 hypothetical protein [Vagococcus sp. DIV0080]